MYTKQPINSTDYVGLREWGKRLKTLLLLAVLLAFLSGLGHFASSWYYRRAIKEYKATITDLSDRLADCQTGQ